jgi:hypothetical protein
MVDRPMGSIRLAAMNVEAWRKTERAARLPHAENACEWRVFLCS